MGCCVSAGLSFVISNNLTSSKTEYNEARSQCRIMSRMEFVSGNRFDSGRDMHMRTQKFVRETSLVADGA